MVGPAKAMHSRITSRDRTFQGDSQEFTEPANVNRSLSSIHSRNGCDEYSQTGNFSFTSTDSIVSPELSASTETYVQGVLKKGFRTYRVSMNSIKKHLVDIRLKNQPHQSRKRFSMVVIFK